MHWVLYLVLSPSTGFLTHTGRHLPKK